MLTLALVVAGAAGAQDWRELDRRPSGLDGRPLPTWYDASRIERRRGLVRVWTRHTIQFFGRNEALGQTRFEIDCARGTGRRLETVEFAPELGRWGSRHRFRDPLRPFEAGGIAEALAPHVCPPR